MREIFYRDVRIEWSVDLGQACIREMPSGTTVWVDSLHGAFELIDRWKASCGKRDNEGEPDFLIVSHHPPDFPP